MISQLHLGLPEGCPQIVCGPCWFMFLDDGDVSSYRMESCCIHFIHLRPIASESMAGADLFTAGELGSFEATELGSLRR